mgnify:FL=1
MAYQATNVSEVENVGSLDRVNRMIVAMILIAVAVLFTTIPAAAVVSIVALGIYVGLTASIGWDPLYALVKAFQQQTPAQIPAPVTTNRRQTNRRKEDHPSGGYKKAA